MWITNDFLLFAFFTSFLKPYFASIILVHPDIEGIFYRTLTGYQNLVGSLQPLNRDEKVNLCDQVINSQMYVNVSKQNEFWLKKRNFTEKRRNYQSFKQDVLLTKAMAEEKEQSKIYINDKLVPPIRVFLCAIYDEEFWYLSYSYSDNVHFILTKNMKKEPVNIFALIDLNEIPYTAIDNETLPSSQDQENQNKSSNSICKFDSRVKFHLCSAANSAIQRERTASNTSHSTREISLWLDKDNGICGKRIITFGNPSKISYFTDTLTCVFGRDPIHKAPFYLSTESIKDDYITVYLSRTNRRKNSQASLVADARLSIKSVLQ